jgi:hypothetical protein
MVLVLSSELLSQDRVNPPHECEAVIFPQRLRARLLFWRAIAVVLVTSLRWDQIRQKAESVVYNFCIQGF